MNIVLSGTIGRSGTGGQAWAVLQYLLGLRSLGHEVYYLEDCGASSWTYQWEEKTWTADVDYPAAYVAACLEPFGFGERWIYRDDHQSRGLPLATFRDILGETDLLILRATPLWTWRPEYVAPRRRAFIDVDPGFTQIDVANGNAALGEGIARAERRFTYAHRLGAADCPIPTEAGPWLPTRPPVHLPEWPRVETSADHFTSVIRWTGFHDVTYGGVTYGQRDKEFPKFFDLPRQTRQAFRMAAMGVDDALTAHGWDVVAGEVVSRTPESYRQFIQHSRAEFSVPKNGYVKMRAGWFSDRSVCYLASGRPVLMEDTGLASSLPVGAGLLTFGNPTEAANGVELINSKYEFHARAAREIAEDHFSGSNVLRALVDTAMN